MPEPTPSTLPELAYREIETALAGTTRGRRFLAEFARRSRSADTQALLDAVAALERRVAETGPPRETARLLDDLGLLLDDVRSTRAEIAGPTHEPASDGEPARDGLLRTAQRAASEIQDAAERIQDIAWTMRESGFDAALCDMLDQRAAEIHAGCSRQDLVTRSLEQHLQLFAMVERRLESLTTPGGSVPQDSDRPKPGGSEPGMPVQALISSNMIGLASVEDAAPPTTSPDVSAAREHALAELARFDALDIRDKLRLFT